MTIKNRLDKLKLGKSKCGEHSFDFRRILIDKSDNNFILTRK